MAILLQASNISKSYGTRTVLSSISLMVQERDRIGLVGVNGAGKSTLLQIISGEMSYDDGEIFKAKDVRIGYLAQNTGLQSDRTIRDEMLDVFRPLLETERELRELEAAMADPKVLQDDKTYQDLMDRYARRSEWFREQGGYEIESRIRNVLHGMGFAGYPQDTVISTLSGGEKTRLAMARLLLQQPDLLLLDEPTNHLDIDTLTWLEQYLCAYPGALVVVSHDRYFLDSLVNVIVEIERHESRRYTGNYSRYIELKAADYESKLKQYEQQQEVIARMEEFIQRNIARASTTKRAQSRRKALEKMERLEKPIGELKKASFSFECAFMSGRDVLQAKDLAVSYEPDGEPLFQGVSLSLIRGESVALIGPNGIGKSSLLKVLVGELKPIAGEVQWGSRVEIGYYDQEQKDLNPHNTVLDELWNEYPHLEEARIRTVLGNFLFSGEDVFKKVSALSGGERARLALAKLMLRNANVLILDEPTNHLDLFSKEVLEAALMDYDGTLLFISHDRYFLNKMADRIIELTPTGAISYLGNYDDYLEKKAELAEIEAERNGQSNRGLIMGKPGSVSRRNGSGGSHANQSAGIGAAAGTHANSGDATNAPISELDRRELEKQTKREQRNRQRRLEQLEADIERMETEIAKLEEQLAHPDVYNDYIKVQEINSSIGELRAALETALDEWSTLAE